MSIDSKKTLRNYKGVPFEETVVITIMAYEGMSFEEAVLSYKTRENLPDEAFCGPNRSYPAQDAAHVRNGLARLGTFGHRLPSKTRGSILACLKSRAKKYNIEVSECTLKEVEETVSWYLDSHKSDLE